MTKKLQELIEEFGKLLIMLRANPDLEFEPHVFKHKLLEIAQLAEEEGFKKAIKFVRTGYMGGGFAEGCKCKDCNKFEKKILNQLLSNQEEDEQ